MPKDAVRVIAKRGCDRRINFRLAISHSQWWSWDHVFVHVESVEWEIDRRVALPARLSLGSTEALKVNHKELW